MPADAATSASDATARDAAIAALRERFGDRLSTGEAIRRQHGTDESYHPTVAPDAVLFAMSTEEVSEAVKICAARKWPVIPFGDRKSVVSGKSVSVRVDLGGRRIIKKKKTMIRQL